MHYNCLIVDDETDLARMTAEYFNMFEVSSAYAESADACFEFLKDNTVDLILLDINLGDGSGFDVCKRIREEKQLPILFISARQSDDDVLVALSVGGDDYVKKPYSLSVLLAKVKVNLKHVEQMKALTEEAKNAGTATGTGVSGTVTGLASANGTGANGTASNGSNTSVDGSSANGAEDGKEEILGLDEPTLSAILEGKRIPLKAKEFALLACLYNHKNTIVKKEVLFDEVWGDSFFSDSTLNVHIRKLREKLEENPNEPKLIKTVWGTGYYLELN